MHSTIRYYLVAIMCGLEVELSVDTGGGEHDRV